jgi:hypothetical protein
VRAGGATLNIGARFGWGLIDLCHYGSTPRITIPQVTEVISQNFVRLGVRGLIDRTKVAAFRWVTGGWMGGGRMGVVRGRLCANASTHQLLHSDHT